MTAPNVSGIEVVEGADRAADAANSKAITQNLTEILAAGFKRENIDQPPADGAAPDPNAAAAAVAAAGTGVDAGPAGYDENDFEEAEKVLSEMGIDLGVSYRDVPVELRPQYERLINSAIDVAEDTLGKQIHASEGQREFDEFKDRVEKSPDKLLLSMVLSHPQLVSQASALVQQMQENPAVRDAVIREIEVEMKLQEANRKERMLAEREKRLKANQVISATRRSAREHAVDYATAEKVVALAIQANGGDLSPDEVDGIVRELKPAAPAQRVIRPQVITPAQAAAAKAAPQGSVSGAQATPSTLSPGLTEAERKYSGGRFRGIIRDAMARLGQQ